MTSALSPQTSADSSSLGLGVLSADGGIHSRDVTLILVLSGTLKAMARRQEQHIGFPKVAAEIKVNLFLSTRFPDVMWAIDGIQEHLHKKEAHLLHECPRCLYCEAFLSNVVARFSGSILFYSFRPHEIIWINLCNPCNLLVSAGLISYKVQPTEILTNCVWGD